MKITKRQLRRIIKEERAKLLEARISPRGLELRQKISNVIKELESIDLEELEQMRLNTTAYGVDNILRQLIDIAIEDVKHDMRYRDENY